MASHYAAPWHRASYDRFVHDRLPELLAGRLPLVGYQAISHETSVEISVTITGPSGEVTAAYTLPWPDTEGRFLLQGVPHVVVPVATSDDLATAEIRCVGEQLYDTIAGRLGEAPAELAWDESLLRRWLPLAEWVDGFLASRAQRVDTTNRIAALTHLRRLLIPGAERVITSGQFGRTCPFEVPEGPDLPYVRSLALGAEIADGHLNIVDASPEMALGLTASMVPLLEHNDPNRQLMGVNMMRQWISPRNPEPPLVQTGREPAEPGIWCGHNLLTAYVSWGNGTYEDALLMSASCADRLQYDSAVEVGDKFSNRHGAKGVISRIVPDDEMPHLLDGTPVDLVYNFVALHTRMNFGQVREAVLGRIAHAEGRPIIVPPYHGPDEAELRARLHAAGLPKEGMEYLTTGRSGARLARPSLVGWVYWGRTIHISARKEHVAVTPEGPCQHQGELEFQAMREVSAFANLLETFNTRSAERSEAASLGTRVATGPIQQAPPPSPFFADIVRRLAAAGIDARLIGGQLAFSMRTPDPALELARPVPHPWLREQEITKVGVLEELPEYRALVKANSRLAHLLKCSAPAALAERAYGELRLAVEAFFAALLVSKRITTFQEEAVSRLRPHARVLFSGRTVIAPSIDLPLDCVGVADNIAWTIFGPLVVRTLGNEYAVAERTREAAQTLDEIMAHSWVVMNRAPTVIPTALLAFHPVRIPEPVFRLHPLACMLMNADFDGDQEAVFLPLTEGAQREAGEKLSIAGHLRRDPELVRWLCPADDAMWGLAWLSLTDEGRRQLSGPLGALPTGLLTRPMLTEVLRDILQRDGVSRLLTTVEQLHRFGIDAAMGSGASMSPFLGASVSSCMASEVGDPTVWETLLQECAERLAAATDYGSPDFGPQLLAVKAGARGQMGNLTALMVGGTLQIDGQRVPIRHGFVHGVAPEEIWPLVVQAREALYRVTEQTVSEAYGIRQRHQQQGFTVLARARRADNPGIVFAHAAATGEVDPLLDVDSRLFVGLPVE